MSEVGRFFEFSDTSVTSLEGLNGLRSVATLGIGGNSLLLNLDALSGLTSAQYEVVVADNASLQNIDGLSGITFTHLVVISGNASLTSIEGLGELVIIGPEPPMLEQMTISDNPRLANLVGLEGISLAMNLSIIRYEWRSPSVTRHKRGNFRPSLPITKHARS